MKEIPVYYQKPICRLRDCKEGDWVYDTEAHLCYVTDDNDNGMPHLHYFYIESYPSLDSFVYPITLTTARICNDMRSIYDKYFENDLINPDIRRELEEDLYQLMIINQYDPEASIKYNDRWKMIEYNLEQRIKNKKPTQT